MFKKCFYVYLLALVAHNDHFNILITLPIEYCCDRVRTTSMKLQFLKPHLKNKLCNLLNLGADFGTDLPVHVYNY